MKIDLSELENTLQHVAGELRATRFMLGVLIRSHPYPQQMLSIYEERLPQWTDQLATHETTGTHPTFHTGVQNGLSAFGNAIADAQRPNDDVPDPPQ